MNAVYGFESVRVSRLNADLEVEHAVGGVRKKVDDIFTEKISLNFEVEIDVTVIVSLDVGDNFAGALAVKVESSVSKAHLAVVRIEKPVEVSFDPFD